MVLTSPEPPEPPSRGKTLPNPALLRQSHADLSTSSANRLQKAHTLPSNQRGRTVSAIDLHNAINNNHFRTRTPQSVSILSLHQSDDNEGYCFDNSALQFNDDDIHLNLSPTPSAAPEDDNVFEDVDLNSKDDSNDIPEGFKVAYRDAKSVPTRSSSWYDGFLHCLKPVMSSFMGKGKPTDGDSNKQGKSSITIPGIRKIK